jgi:hypothetical protein
VTIAGDAVSPPALLADHVLQAGVGFSDVFSGQVVVKTPIPAPAAGLIGVGRFDPAAPDALGVVYAETAAPGDITDRVLLLRFDGARLDGPEALLGAPDGFAALLPILGDERLDLAEPERGLRVRPSDATGRFGPVSEARVDGFKGSVGVFVLREGPVRSCVVALIGPGREGLPETSLARFGPLGGGVLPPPTGLVALAFGPPGTLFGLAGTADFDGDGWDEVLVAAGDGDLFLVAPGFDSAAGPSFLTGTFIGAIERPDDLAAVDLDGDRLLDIGAARADNGFVSVLQAAPLVLETPTIQKIATSVCDPSRTVLGDFTGDGLVDALSLASIGPIPTIGCSSEVLELARNGDGRLGAPEVVYTFPADAAALLAIARADVDLDGALDIVAVSAADVRVLLGDGRGGFTPGRRFAFGLAGLGLGEEGPRILVGDIDADGIEDLVITGFDTVTLFGDGRGGFRRPDAEALPRGP